MNTSSAASTTVIPDGHSAQLFGVADSRAQIAAERQAAGKPWLCPHHKVHVTNEKCKAMKIASDTRQCSDCGLPLSLNIVTREELQMSRFGTCQNCGRTKMSLPAKGLCGKCYRMDRAGELKPKEQATPVIPASKQLVVGSEDHFVEPNNMVPAEALPNWEDFTPVPPISRAKAGTFHVNIRPGKYVLLSGALAEHLGWKEGQGVEGGFLGDKALGLRHCPEWLEGQNYRLTNTPKSYALRAYCSNLLKDCSAERGSYLVTVTPWGVIVHLDRPAAGKA